MYKWECALWSSKIYLKKTRLFNIWKSINTIYHINRIKDKPTWSYQYMQGKKNLDKIKHPFLIKRAQQTRKRRECLPPDKWNLWKTHYFHYAEFLQDQKEDKDDAIQHWTGSSSKNNKRQQNNTKVTQIRKAEVKYLCLEMIWSCI